MTQEILVQFPGFANITVTVGDSSTSTFVIQECLKQTELGFEYEQFFSLFFQTQCFYLESNEVISSHMIKQQDKVILLFRHFAMVPELQQLCNLLLQAPTSDKVNPKLIYILLHYCVYSYRSSLWACTEQTIIQTTALLRVFAESYQDSFISAQNLKLTSPLSKLTKQLLPERHTCFSTLYSGRLEKYYQAAAAMKYQAENLIINIIQLIAGSAYFGLSNYPVKDVDFDWTSIISIAFDGIVLLDAEIGISYLYLPFHMFDVESQEDVTVIIKTHTKVMTRASSMKSFAKNSQFLEPQVIQQNKEPLSNQTIAQKGINVIANMTKNFEIPMIKPTLADGTQQDEENKMIQLRVAQSEKFMQKEHPIDYYENETELFETNDTDLRKQLVLKFISKRAADNFRKILLLYSSTFDFQLFKCNRFMKSMSQCHVELLKSVYMNNCQKYSVRPSQMVLEKIDSVLDRAVFENRFEIFDSLVISNEHIHHLHIRSILQAISTVLNFRPQNSCMRVDFQNNGELKSELLVRNNGQVVINETESGKTVFFQRGAGTPYEPFIPVRLDMRQNINLKVLKFINNDFTNLVYVYEIADFLQNLQVQHSLEELEISRNLFMNKSLIVLSNKMKDLKSIKSVSFNHNELTANGISCSLYLWDFNKIYLNSLSLRNAKMTTKAAFNQLGQYIGRCVVAHDRFLKLDLTNMKINYLQAEQFYKGYEKELQSQKINVSGDKRIDQIQVFGLAPDALDLFMMLAVDVLVSE